MPFHQLAKHILRVSSHRQLGYGVGYKAGSYRLNVRNAAVDLPLDDGPSTSFDYVVPVLGDPEATLCMRAGAATESLYTERCGLEAGATDVSIVLQAPPHLITPPENAMISTTSTISWSAFDGGIHLLTFDPGAVAGHPAIRVNTSNTAMSLADVIPPGINLPPTGAYACTVGGLGPFASIDEAVGPAGLATLIPKETRKSFADPRRVTITR